MRADWSCCGDLKSLRVALVHQPCAPPAGARAENARSVHAGFAESAAVSIDTQMESTGAAPLLAMAAFVQEDPQYSNLGKWFEPVARKLLAAVSSRGQSHSWHVQA